MDAKKEESLDRRLDEFPSSEMSPEAQKEVRTRQKNLKKAMNKAVAALSALETGGVGLVVDAASSNVEHLTAEDAESMQTRILKLK